MSCTRGTIFIGITLCLLLAYPGTATANYLSNDVKILYGNGDGSFQPPESHPAGDGPVAVRTADLNNDGFDEIVTGRGPGRNFHARVRGWDFDGAELEAMDDVDFAAFAPIEMLHGVNVAANR